jgi:hypothetical protein
MQYPKMLYKGNQDKYQTVIANDEDHESELMEQGWCEYCELPEWERGVLNPHDATKDCSNPFAELEEQLATSQGEFIAFQNDVGAMKARIAELEPISALGSVLNPNNQSDLTLEQLQAELDAKGIKYLKRDSKATLLELLSNQA